MKLIRLTLDKYAMIDDEDYDSLSVHNWHAYKGHNTYYARRKPGKVNINMHRVIMNAPQGMVVDHIDGDGLNNQKSNLRVLSYSDNLVNTKKRSGQFSSKYKGVFWSKQYKKWRAQITVNYKNILIGYFTKEETAAKEYNKKVKEVRGDKAVLNSV